MKQLLGQFGTALAAMTACGTFAVAQPAGAPSGGGARGGCAGCGTVIGIYQTSKPVPVRSAPPPAASAPAAKPAAAQPAPQGREDKSPRRPGFEVVIEMDDGSERRMLYQNRPALDVGDKVRLRHGQIYLR
ncbi:MAG TPA: hypothetical protein VM491_01820 [Burkholderiaceae bacterium]|jgi:hypothetical protein|nr:hypothetical protein [Burkholderiaceae bacterium]